MLLIDEIVEMVEPRAVCRTTLKPDCVFAQGGAIHPSAMIELVAQACAIYVGIVAARSGDPPRLGLIIACREITFDVDQFAVGDELTIIVHKQFGQSQLAAFTGTVSRGGAVCTTVQLSVADAAVAGQAGGEP